MRTIIHSSSKDGHKLELIKEGHLNKDQAIKALKNYVIDNDIEHYCYKVDKFTYDILTEHEIDTLLGFE